MNRAIWAMLCLLFAAGLGLIAYGLITRGEHRREFIQGCVEARGAPELCRYLQEYIIP